MFSSSVFAILYPKIKRLNEYCISGLKFITSISSLTQSPTSTNKGDLYISNVEGTLTNFGGHTVKQGDGLIYNGSGWDKIAYSELIGANDIISLTSNVEVGAIPAGTVVNNTSAELWRMALVKNLGLLVTLTGTLPTPTIVTISFDKLLSPPPTLIFSHFGAVAVLSYT